MIKSAEEFIALRTSEDRELYIRATHDSAPEDVWLEIIAKYSEMKVWVAHNKTISHNILKLLASDNDPLVRAAVARRRRADPDILEQLADDPDSGVRLTVALNAKTPISVLRKLTNDSWERIAEVARGKTEDLK